MGETRQRRLRAIAGLIAAPRNKKQTTLIIPRGTGAEDRAKIRRQLIDSFKQPDYIRIDD